MWCAQAAIVFDGCCGVVSRCRVSARRPRFFSLLRQRKEPKRKATLLPVSPSLRYGAACDARAGRAAVELTALQSSSVRTATASQCTRHARSDAHAPCLRSASRHGQKGTRTPHTGHRGARPGSGRPSAAMARADSQPPSVCAEEHRARGGRVCRRTHPLRDLTRRGCPSGARQRAASSTAPPRDRAPQVAPFAAGERGRRQQGRPFFAYFLSAKRKKVSAPPGAHPGPGKQTSREIKNDSCMRLFHKR